jgi:hypothetical protein
MYVARALMPAAPTLVSALVFVLLSLLLLLLTDADFRHLRLRVRESLMIVPAHGFGKVCIDIRVLGKHSHQRVACVAGGAKRPEPFDIRDCHKPLSYQTTLRNSAVPYPTREERE